MAWLFFQDHEVTIVSDNARSHATFPLHHTSETDYVVSTAATRRKPTKLISRWSSDDQETSPNAHQRKRTRKIPNNKLEPPARWQQEPLELLNATASSATYKNATFTTSRAAIKANSAALDSRWNIGSEKVTPAINRPLDMMAMRKPPRRQPSLRRIDSDDGIVQLV